MPRLGDILALLDAWFDPRWAEPWDAVGLVCGDRSAQVSRMTLAVDAVPATVDEALGAGAQLLLTHHPLLLTPVHSVATDEPKGALVHRMITGGLAHFVAHTNADVADPGVSDALANRIGLRELRPLDAMNDQAMDKLVVYVPLAELDRVVDALAAAGAGALGVYDRCAWSVEGTGTFRPLAGARPAIGAVGRVEQVREARVEMVVPAGRRGDVISALRAAHPYEEPAFDLFTLVGLPTSRGIGRVGELPEAMTLSAFTALAAERLPRTVWGLRAAGDPGRAVRRVAVCGGSGGSYASRAVTAGADALLTADLKHHSTLEAVTERGPGAMALLDAAHWATEAPWLDAVARRLRLEFGTSLDVRVSAITTDPWTVHAPSPESSPTDT